MPRPLFRRFLAMALTIVASLGLLAAGSAQAARSFSTGIIDIDAFQVHGPLAFEHANATGAKYLKNNLYWDHVAPGPEESTRPGTAEERFVATDPGSPYYQWGTYDNIVREASANGMTPILTIVNAPRWARLKCDESSICSPKPGEYANFATAAAKRYSGDFDPGDGNGVLPRVAFWQAWVEPNLYHFYSPIFSPSGGNAAPSNYRTILNAFYDAIHAVDRSNTVIAAGLAPNGVPDKAIAPMTFTREVLCMAGTVRNPKPKPGCNARTKADVWAVHPYTTGAPTHFPANSNNMSVAALPRMVRLIEAAGRAGHLTGKTARVPLWATEFSWDSNPPDPGGLKSATQMRWVAQAMYMMYRARVDTLIWFGMRDDKRIPGRPWGESMESGLYLRGKTIAQDRRKPVFRVFRYPFYAELARKGFRFWGRTPGANGRASGRKKIVLYARKRSGSRYLKVRTVWTNPNGIFTGSVRGRGYRRSGAVKAKIVGGEMSVPFGLQKTKDFFQPPFGG
ncbi:MAG: hypothetical protein M9938_00970 [Solirubrobacterales bacterium]|nr:hypothetical protein [Solirubrobacterales bacterium]